MARRNVAVLVLAFLSPAMTYALDLRLAQLIGPQTWLDEFRTLQIPLVAALMAATVLFPQIVVPMATEEGNVDWEVLKACQITILAVLGICALVVISWPEWIARVLSRLPVAESGRLIAAVPPFGLSVVFTLASGLNAACLMATGKDAWLYTIALGPTVGALCCLQLERTGAGLYSMSMFTLAGALLLYAGTSIALLRGYLRRERLIRGTTRRLLTMFGKQELQLVGALVANQLSTVILIRVLTQESAGAVSIFSFALKILSLVTLPSLVIANRLLAVLPSVKNLEHEGARRCIAGKSAAICLLYSVLMVIATVLASDLIVRIVFFNAKFTPGESSEISLTLKALVFGVPAMVQGFIWTRINALEKLTQYTLAGACATLGFSWIMAALQPNMDVIQVAMTWSIGISLQSVILLARDPIDKLRPIFLRGSHAVNGSYKNATALAVLTGFATVFAAMLVFSSEHSGLALVVACNLFCLVKIWRVLPAANSIRHVIWSR